MTPLIAQIERGDVADFVSNLFLVYFVLILARIVLSWIIVFRGSLPYNPVVRGVSGFLEQTVDPYLNLFRRLLPPIGGSRMAIDITPIIAIIALLIVQALVVGLIRG